MSCKKRTRLFQIPEGAHRLATGAGFTLLELMLAIALLSMISTLAYMTFSSVTNAWKRGMALTEDLHHGDFAVEQLVMAFRSAYYPDALGKGDAYGMIMEDNGSGESASDTISWVKLGSAMIGKDSKLVDSPHRVRVSVEEDANGRQGVAVRAWRLQGQPDTFDETQVVPVFLSTKVTGLNVRTAYKKVGDEIDWLDEWEDTNRIPTVVELTLFLEPLQEGEAPVEIKRVFGIPVAPLAWRN